jgi:hypothetical protein
MTNSIHPEPTQGNSRVADPRPRSKRRIVLYVLVYLAICAAAWSVAPLSAQSLIPHNGTVPPINGTLPFGPTMFLPVAVQRATLRGTIGHNGTLPGLRLFLPVAVQRSRLTQECLAGSEKLQEDPTTSADGQPC